MYSIEIRGYDGETLASGTGRTDWKRTTERLARKARLSGTGPIAVDTYFPTDEGRPIGTHHVQFGRYVPKARATSLSRTYIVSVQQA